MPLFGGQGMDQLPDPIPKSGSLFLRELAESGLPPEWLNLLQEQLPGLPSLRLLADQEQGFQTLQIPAQDLE